MFPVENWECLVRACSRTPWAEALGVFSVACSILVPPTRGVGLPRLPETQPTAPGGLGLVQPCGTALPRTLWLDQAVGNPLMSVSASVTTLGVAQPGEMGASYPSPVCCRAAGLLIACLRGAVRAAVLAWHTCMLQSHLYSEPVGGCVLRRVGRRSAFPWDRSQGRAACVLFSWQRHRRAFIYTLSCMV